MQSIDYDAVAAKRRENFNYLHKHLSGSNQLHLTLGEDMVPMVYPYLPDKDGLRDYLIQNKVYVAKYWPNVQNWCQEQIELVLTNRLIPIPIDQRYEKEEMSLMLNLIESWKSRYAR